MDHLTGLRIFVRVAELRSFSQAAEDLGIAQSTVTKNVAWLEAHVGVRLLSRNTRGVSLNEAGRLYYERARAILRQVEEADALVRSRDGQLDGTLRISTSVAFGEAVIGPLLVSFMRANPRLKVDLACEDGYVDLIARGVDVALRMGRLADSSLGGRYLGANPWVMVGAPAYLEERGRPRVPDDLTGHDCIVYSSVQGDAVWQLRAQGGPTSAGGTHAASVRGALRSNNLPTLLSAARSGLGIAILPRYVAEGALRRGELEALMTDHTLPDQELYAVFPSPKLVSAKVTALIRFLGPRLRGDWWRSAESIDPGINDIAASVFEGEAV
ncbi:LysR family transcriptional regulator [Methylobacterium sp. A54F]